MAVQKFPHKAWINKLLKGFTTITFCVIAIFTITISLLLSELIQESHLQKDAMMVQDSVSRIVHNSKLSAYFTASASANLQVMDAFSREFMEMFRVIRVSVINTNNQIIWSSNENVVGISNMNNQFIKDASAGNAGYQSGFPRDLVGVVTEASIDRDDWLVANYIPVIGDDHQGVIGVIEILRAPIELANAIDRGTTLIWSSILTGGIILYLVLFAVIRQSDKLIRSQQEKLSIQTRLATIGEMASSVAHSIRNPIASIRSSAELSIEESDEPEIVESMKDIICEVERFDLWVNELLIFTHAVSNPNASTDLVEVIEASLSHFSNRAQRTGISIQTKLSQAEQIVNGEYGLLVQVMNSLIANAFDAMPHGGQLMARVSADKHSVRLTLSDTGFGIPPERLSSLFDPLVTHKNGGLGIGLALVNQVIKRYQGHIDISSTVGAGTDVSITLPLKVL